MHSYMRAVGFSQCKSKEDIKKILKDIINNPDEKMVVSQEGISDFFQIDKLYGKDFGIAVCGEYGEDGILDIEYCFPVFFGDKITTFEVPAIEKHAATESYAGLCDDYRVGISIIFYINNVADYKRNETSLIEPEMNNGIILTGLAMKGKILLPTNKTDYQKRADQEAVQQRIQLISAAKQGDEQAIESLTLEDIDNFTMVGRRIGKEDILTIVESYFMPRGIECDQYTILGEILDYHLETNSYSQEKVYIITVNCNEIVFDVCINQLDLLGEPEVGRRLKADIWLQGTVLID